MNKTELINAIAEKSGKSKVDVAAVFNAYTEVVIEAMKNKERIQIPGFGTYNVTHRNEKAGINPKTKEKITIPASDVPKFGFSKSIKEAVNK